MVGRYDRKQTRNRIGYARVSTYGQTLDAQLAQLREDGCATIYREKASGARADRRELGRMLRKIEAGDVASMVVPRLENYHNSDYEQFKSDLDHYLTSLYLVVWSRNVV